MKLHLGCGSNYINGWVNIDFDSPTADLRIDLRNGLPFPDGSVEFIFTEHFIEHITKVEAEFFLNECRRVLMPSGRIRTSTPDLKFLVDNYLSGKLDEWVDVGWEPRSSCDLANEGMRLWGHQYLYDHNELERLLTRCGFQTIEWQSWQNSLFPTLQNLECRPYHTELIVEASPN